MTREVYAPKGRYSGRHKVYCTVYRDWNKLCQNRPGPMRRCYIELADNPFPPLQTNRHHQLKGKLKGFWEYEVDGGARVRYKRGPDDRVVVLVVYAGPAEDVRIVGHSLSTGVLKSGRPRICAQLVNATLHGDEDKTAVTPPVAGPTRNLQTPLSTVGLVLEHPSYDCYPCLSRRRRITAWFAAHRLSGGS